MGLELRIQTMSTKVTGLICPKCGWFIYSRARHDFHSCPCGGVSVDGGFDYFRGLAEPGLNPESETRTISVTRSELWDDWNNRADRFGKQAPVGIPNPVKGLQLTLFPMGREH